MFSSWQLAALLVGFFALITLLAWQKDAFSHKTLANKSHPWVYSLGLGVYASSWMLYGSIGQAATSGWLFLSIFIGPLLTFIFAWPLVKKIFRISKAYNLTSIADFIASRYGKWQPLAVMITLFTLVASLGYLALQLKAMTMAFNLLTSSRLDSVAANTPLPWYLDLTFYLALGIAGFTLLFGTKHLDATERHTGLLQALAFKALLKLVLFLILGSVITWVYFNGFQDLLQKAEFFRPLETQFTTSSLTEGFLAQTFLAMLAVILLPHMFHVSIVESSHFDDSKHARWFLPAYLLLLAVFIMPVATAGLIVFADSSLDPDALALGLPLAYKSKLLAAAAFIAGLTAVVGMASISSLAASLMFTNEIALPLMLRKSWQANNSYQTFSQLVLRTRRISVVAVMLLAYLVYLFLNSFSSLAALGFLCLAAIGQLAPAAFGGIIWKGGNRWGAAAGLIIGGLLWFYTLVLPSFAYLEVVSQDLLNYGPWGLSWLKPTSLFGLPGQGFFSHGVFWSLSLNLAAYILVSRLTPNRLIDRIQASAFVDNLEIKPIKNSRLWKGATKVIDLRSLAERFMSTSSVNFAFNNYASVNNLANLNNDSPASIDLIQFTERLLASVLGATSARIVMHSALKGKEINITDVVSIVDEASQVLEFNRSLLHSTLENLSQGVCVIDQQFNLVVWNQAYLDLFDFPEGFIYLGCPATDLFSYKIQQDAAINPEQKAKRLEEQLTNIKSGLAHSYIQKNSRNNIIAVQANPMPGNGFVFSFQDITSQKQTEAALIQSENNTRIYTDSVPALIAYFDTQINYLFMNKSYEVAMGLNRNQVIGKAVYKVLKPEDYAQRKPYIDAALLGKKQSFELQLTTNKHTAFRYAMVTYTPHLNNEGEILGFFALYQDITHRRAIETALKETNEHLEERVKERTLAYSELNAKLFQENQIRAQAEDAMRLAKQQAEEANASKTHFLAAASHDLLQPLNAARLFASVLTNQVTDAQAIQTAQHLDNSLQAAEELLSTLLDISKLDAGAIQPKISHFALDEILRPLTAEFEVMAQKRGLTLKFVPTKAWVKSDPQMLRRIIQNFLSNALRYTSSGKVLLGCRHLGQRLSIQVVDTGPGIPKSRLGDIFQEFRRLDTPDKHNEKGLGLGLSIAERMAKVLGHQIGVSSEYGKGTVFSLSLNKVASQTSETKKPAKPLGLNNLAGVSILCIDNEPLILEGMQALLEGWGCKVVTSANRKEALAAKEASQQPIDIYLADYHLDANKTGVEALKALEAVNQQPLSGIIITADRTAEIANEISAAGYLLLHKPVKPAALRASITRLIQSKQRQA